MFHCKIKFDVFRFRIQCRIKDISDAELDEGDAVDVIPIADGSDNSEDSEMEPVLDAEEEAVEEVSASSA